MRRKKALITGITGQDGSYLAELLLGKGYSVHGIVRRSSSMNRGRIDHLFAAPRHPRRRFNLHYGDLTDGSSLNRILEKVRPDEIYHLGAQSHVRVSFEVPEYTGDVTGLGCLRLLDALKDTRMKARFYQASSSEMFGNAKEVPQKETTRFCPASPYACAKVYAYHLTVNYREAYGLFACNGILFNHESPRRGENFVSRKIARGVARIKAGVEKKLHLGNLEARRDWGFAPEYVEAMWLMLQQDKPGDYVIATAESHTVREFVELAFAHAGLDWKKHVEIDPRYFRPTEVAHLRGDFSKARRVLKWKPKVKFKELVRIMVDAEMRAASLAEA
ncbi:MAG: GDP-mannose 4,6-dehydratase [Elusimicrobiota bacterium]